MASGVTPYSAVRARGRPQLACSATGRSDEHCGKLRNKVFGIFETRRNNDEVESYEQVRFVAFPAGADFSNRNVRPGSVPNPGQGRRQGGGEIHEHPLRTIVAKETSTTPAAFATRT